MHRPLDPTTQIGQESDHLTLITISSLALIQFTKMTMKMAQTMECKDTETRTEMQAHQFSTVSIMYNREH